MAGAQQQPSSEPKPVAVVGDRWIRVGDGALVPAFSTHALDQTQADVDTAAIVIHGAGRDADVYYAGMVAAVRHAESAGLARSRATLVVAPQFLTERDASAHRLAGTAAYWTSDAWKGGEPALSPASHPSSFLALDALIELFTDRTRFPALRRIVIAGHSAGGQVLHRYTVLARGDAAAERAGVDVRYVVANPSSYLYLTAERPTSDGGFAPYRGTDCAGFDDYRFGLMKPPPYAGGRTRDALAAAYKARRVIYLLGSRDIDPAHRSLDRSCAAMAQGAYRLARGEAYFRYLLQHLGPETARTHRKVVVEGVGHDGAAMFGSPAGQAALFGAWAP